MRCKKLHGATYVHIFVLSNAVTHIIHTQKLTVMQDLLGNIVQLPKIGDTIENDGCTFIATNVRLVDELEIVATIDFKGESGAIVLGYYEWVQHYKR